MTIRELHAGETGAAFDAMQALPTHLDDAAQFARRVDELQRPQGYRSSPSSRTRATSAPSPAFASWRCSPTGACCTSTTSRRCRDSGVGPERLAAHRLYLNSGMRISSHHFARQL